jgi:ATP-dependent 26S proteasome regulatory subunit
MTLKTTKTKLYESKQGQPQEKDEAVLEGEIGKLEKELTEEKKALGKEKKVEVKEKLKEIYQSELEKEKKAEQETEDFRKEQLKTGTAAPPTKTKTKKQVSDDAAKIKKMDQKNQVKALIKLVFAKNIAYAIKVARNLDSPYVLDEFHDTLVDEHYEEMVEKKKIKKT